MSKGSRDRVQDRKRFGANYNRIKWRKRDGPGVEMANCLAAELTLAEHIEKIEADNKRLIGSPGVVVIPPSRARYVATREEQDEIEQSNSGVER